MHRFGDVEQVVSAELETTKLSTNAADKASERKELIKRMQGLQLMNKDETLRLRRKHVGYVA